MRDASAFVGSWPFSLAQPTTIDGLVATLRHAGFISAAVTPMDAVLKPDPLPANRSLLRCLNGQLDLTVHPVPVLNPTLNGWCEQLDVCQELAGGRISAVKVTPNYHGYQLDNPGMLSLAAELQRRRVGLCVQVRMFDERAHHPLMTVPAVPAPTVQELASQFPDLRIMVCGSYLRELIAYCDNLNVTAELSFVESGHLLEQTLAVLPAERLAVGTHAPLHVAAAGAAKPDSDDLPGHVRQQLTDLTFQRFYGQATEIKPEPAPAAGNAS